MSEMSVPELVKLYSDITLELSKKVHTYVKDKSIPLDDRWDIWCKIAGSITIRDLSIPYFENIDSDWFVTDSYLSMDRHEVRDVEWVYDQLKDPCPWNKPPISVDLDAFREECLEKGIWEFEFDW